MRYTLQAKKGKGRGASVVGFPTINLVAPDDFTAKEGVYAATVWLAGKEYLGALHYGPAPTFDDADKTLEIFLLDYSGTEEITEVTFELGAYLRPVATFLTPVELRKQIALDVQRVRKAKRSAANTPSSEV